MGLAPVVEKDQDQAIQGPDQRALILAQSLQDQAQPFAVYLFGSRARGDWGPDSDIDLMVLSPAKLPSDILWSWRSQLQAEAAAVFDPPPYIQIFNFAQVDFNWARTSLNHVAGGVQRDGLTPQGEPLPDMVQDNPWPHVHQCLKTARHSLYTALLTGEQADVHTMLLQAFHAFENALKAYLSALQVRFDKTHDLERLVQSGIEKDPELDKLIPDSEWRRNLTYFRQVGPYDPDFLPSYPPDETFQTLRSLCVYLAQKALTLCGKSPDQLPPPDRHFPGMNLSLPLAGLEEVEVSYFIAAFNRDTSLQEGHRRGREEGRREGHKQVLLDLVRVLGDANTLAAFEIELDHTDFQDWPSVEATLARFRDTPP